MDYFSRKNSKLKIYHLPHDQSLPLILILSMLTKAFCNDFLIKGKRVRVDEAKKHAIIIGAGPAGLTAGIELLKTKQFSVTVIERDSVVGGLAKTTEHKGCRYDIGPHHFITTEKKVEQWWKDLMQDDFYPHRRFTRIYYNKHFFYYPLRPLNALFGLNFFESIRCVLSYLRVQVFPYKPVKSFEEYVTNKFGFRLFSIFFKTYTEKVWGIKCSQISPEWAAQRIKGFSLFKAIFFAFFGRFLGEKYKKTMSEAFAAETDLFYYPEKGSGTLWEKAANWLTSFPDATINLNKNVVSIEHDGKNIKSVLTGSLTVGPSQRLMTHTGDYFFSTMPLRHLIKSMSPLPPQDVIDAADSLLYRGLITINLKINKPSISPDHWIYIHEKKVKVLRIGNMNNFSMKMVDHETHTALSLEYFDFVGSNFWKKTEQELLEIGAQELEIIGIAKASEVIDGMVQWSPEAYPIYDENYQKNLTLVLDYLKQFSNLKLMGRNGMHRYFNMDIAMVSAFKAVDEVVNKVINKDLEETHALRPEERPES